MHLKPCRHVWRRWALSARVTRCMKSLNKVSRIWRASVLGTAQVLYDKHNVTLCCNHVLLRIPPLKHVLYSPYTRTNSLWLKSYQKRGNNKHRCHLYELCYWTQFKLTIFCSFVSFKSYKTTSLLNNKTNFFKTMNKIK